MIAANPGVDPWLPGAGTEIILPTRYILPPGPREGIVINLAEYRLYYFPKGRTWCTPSRWVSVARVGVRRSPTPASPPRRRTRPGRRLPRFKPSTPPTAILPNVVPAGPDNPLGPFKFTLGTPGYLIHGSNKKFGIGMRTSHGCFRMLNNNVLEMSKMVPVGTPVRIINEPTSSASVAARSISSAHAAG
jgi:L,D-transpeptidase ErfK/SrfK